MAILSPPPFAIDVDDDFVDALIDILLDECFSEFADYDTAEVRERGGGPSRITVRDNFYCNSGKLIFEGLNVFRL